MAHNILEKWSVKVKFDYTYFWSTHRAEAPVLKEGNKGISARFRS